MRFGRLGEEQYTNNSPIPWTRYSARMRWNPCSNATCPWASGNSFWYWLCRRGYSTVSDNTTSALGARVAAQHGPRSVTYAAAGFYLRPSSPSWFSANLAEIAADERRFSIQWGSKRYTERRLTCPPVSSVFSKTCKWKGMG